MKPSRAPSTRRRARGQHTSPDAAAAPAGETHTYEADQDGDLNLQLTMVSFADAKAKKGETYVVYAAADDGAVPQRLKLRGAMDSVSDFESGGCGFESRRSWLTARSPTQARSSRSASCDRASRTMRRSTC